MFRTSVVLLDSPPQVVESGAKNIDLAILKHKQEMVLLSDEEVEKICKRLEAEKEQAAAAAAASASAAPAPPAASASS